MVRTDYLGASHHKFSCIVNMQGGHIMSIGVIVGKKIRSRIVHAVISADIWKYSNVSPRGGRSRPAELWTRFFLKCLKNSCPVLIVHVRWCANRWGIHDRQKHCRKTADFTGGFIGMRAMVYRRFLVKWGKL